MSKQSSAKILTGGALLCLAAYAMAQTEINWQSVDAGGGVSGAPDLQLIGVIGQNDTSRMTGGDLSLSGGYLPLPAASGSIFKDSFE